MKSNGKLATFGEVKAKNEQEVYIPGQIDPWIHLIPMAGGQIDTRLPIAIRYEGELTTRPKRIKKILGTSLPRFQSGQSFRRWGKERIYVPLTTLPSPHASQRLNTAQHLIEMQTPPMHFVDGVPNFSEVGLGVPNAFGQYVPNVERNWWGEIISTIEQGFTQYFEVEKAEEEAKMQALMPTTARFLPAGTSNYLPYIIGGGILLILLKRRKRK